MSKVTLLGIIWVFMVIATVIGLSVYGALTNTDSLAFFRNAQGGIMISGGIMLGSILMIVGGILNNNKYMRILTPKPTDLKEEQREYLKNLLTKNDLSPEERRAIEYKLNKM